MRRMLLALVLGGCLVGGGRPVALAPGSLSNQRVTAQFGDRGLLSLAAPALTPTYRFVHDDFAITLDGQRFDSRALPAPMRTATKDRVRYAWTAGAHHLVVE